MMTVVAFSFDRLALRACRLAQSATMTAATVPNAPIAAMPCLVAICEGFEPS
jgi:hypothetical protein